MCAEMPHPAESLMGLGTLVFLGAGQLPAAMLSFGGFACVHLHCTRRERRARRRIDALVKSGMPKHQALAIAMEEPLKQNAAEVSMRILTDIIRIREEIRSYRAIARLAAVVVSARQVHM